MNTLASVQMPSGKLQLPSDVVKVGKLDNIIIMASSPQSAVRGVLLT